MSDLIQHIQQSAEKFLKVKAEALKSWRSPCHCPDPGTQEECLQCPAFRVLVQQIQTKLSDDGLAAIPTLLPPDLSQDDTEELQQQCRDLYTYGYSIQQICWMTGITSNQKIRRWLRAAGLIGGTTGKEYSLEMRERCVQLYHSGAALRHIEAQLGVPADVVQYWVRIAKLTRPRRHYTEAERQKCVELYQQGYSYRTVESMTGVSIYAIGCWIKELGIKREKSSSKVEPKVFSPEFRQQCMRLLKEGKTPTQVGVLMSVTADTVRKWRKQALKEKNL